jgi:N-acetylmuramic acid 6-phosphate etherase
MLDDRLTEQRNPASAHIDTLSAQELVDLINREDRTIAEAVGGAREPIARAVELVVETFTRGGRLIYVGAGTSGRLGVLDAAEMPPTFGTDPVQVQGVIAGGYDALVKAQEGAEDSPQAGAQAMDVRMVCDLDFVLGIATSGSTPYVHGALNRARELGARTGFLLCTHPPDGMTDVHDVVIPVLVGPEVVTGSTRMKAGTATKLVLNSITTSAMILSGKVYSNLMVDLQVTCEKLEDRGQRMLRSLLDISEEKARDLLHHSGGHVKTAIVMHRLDVDRIAAQALLEGAGGVVVDVVGELE